MEISSAAVEGCSSEQVWEDEPGQMHVVQLYKNDFALIGQLSDFVMRGFLKGDCAVIIATESHISQLETKITQNGFDVNLLGSDNLYISLDATEMLSRFMVNGWPDELLFFQTVSEVLASTGYPSRRLRAFGEMVALLWAEGRAAATIHLEHLWNKFCEQHPFCLFCAYPANSFANDLKSSVQHICRSHSKIIGEEANEFAAYYSQTHVSSTQGAV